MITTDETLNQLWKSILINPEEDLLRLLYAERLMEIGDERVKCKCNGGYINTKRIKTFGVDRLHPQVETNVKCPKCHGEGTYIDDNNHYGLYIPCNSKLAQFIVDQIEGRVPPTQLLYNRKIAPCTYRIARGFVDEFSIAVSTFFGEFKLKRVDNVFVHPITKINLRDIFNDVDVSWDKEEIRDRLNELLPYGFQIRYNPYNADFKNKQEAITYLNNRLVKIYRESVGITDLVRRSQALHLTSDY